MSDRLEETVAEFIRRHGLFAGAERILLAVSGGADSIALLHILTALKARGRIEADLVCAHINHQLRGPASEADEQFVVAQANLLSLPVVARAVEARAHAQRQRLSLETAARQLRLGSLTEIARGRACAWIATGHQKNDNAETVLQRLLRGTGFRGLAGIRPMRPWNGLRLASPLLGTTRREIIQYLERHDLRWHEDQTNVDVAYTRNYIRHRLLPFLEEQAQSDLVEELSELGASAGRLSDRVEREAREAWSNLIEPTADKVVVHASGLASLPEIVAVELIRRAIADLAAGRSELAKQHYRALLELARGNGSGKEISLPDGFVARREGDRIRLHRTPPPRTRRVLLTPLLPAPIVLAVPGEIRFSGHVVEARILSRDEIDAANLTGDKAPRVEYLDLDQVKLPVVVRSREAGDRFRPLGMIGEKKVGKFLTTAKVPRGVREQALIFADREKIVWVYPVRISDRVKITEQTRRVLQLTIDDRRIEGGRAE
jgi:tRNA(Ile)-lysidine synthase